MREKPLIGRGQPQPAPTASQSGEPELISIRR
jgi:hypothetical protein